MIRQYRLLTKTHLDDEAIQLRPTIHADLYNIPEVRSAVDYVKENPEVEMVGIRIDTRFYSVVVVYNEEVLEDHFEF